MPTAALTTGAAGKPFPVSGSAGQVSVNNAAGAGAIYIWTLNSDGSANDFIKLMPGESGSINMPAGGTCRYTACQPGATCTTP